MESAEWKNKAIQRSGEIKRLKKTIKEVKIGKEKWKQKAIAHKSRADKLESDLKKVKEGLSKIVVRSL